MASSSLVMIFVQHSTDGCPPNSGPEKQHQRESIHPTKKAFTVLSSQGKLYPLSLSIKKKKHKTIWILSGLTNKQFFFSLPILHYVLSKGTTWFPILWKIFNLTKEHTTSPCSPTFGERYVANQDASLPVLKTPKGWILPALQQEATSP